MFVYKKKGEGERCKAADGNSEIIKPMVDRVDDGPSTYERDLNNGILPDLKEERREGERFSQWPTNHAPDNESLPNVRLTSGGKIFQVGELEGPGKMKEYKLVIKIGDICGLLEFLPSCLLTVNEELRLVLVLVYEIFGHEIRSDVFEPNNSILDDVTEIRIRSRLGPLKSYFMKVCPTISIKLHPVLNWQDKTGSTSSLDLKLGQPIANDMDPHKGQMSVPTDQESMAVGSKGDSKEIDWSITPIEVWASSGEAFVQLSDVYNDVDHIRTCAEKATMSQTCNRNNSPLSNKILEDQDIRGATKHSCHGTVRKANVSPIRSKLYNQPILKRIFVYKNQETSSGSVLVWGESLDAILEEARVKLNCQKMPAKLCTLDGEKVTRLTDLKQDQLVCLLCSGERFISNGMHPAEIKANWTRARQTYGSDSTEVVVQPRENPLVGVDPFAPTNTNLHKRENLQSDLKRINVYENGKPIRTAQPVTGDSLNQLLERTTILLRLPQAAVCFYTGDGMKITAFQQILHEDILAVSTTGQGFIPTRMDETPK
ncbi:hypothetical protein P879_06964 [Paragonimus westermani]|uniref:Doublecortin domain-containing protein n=1 Tax=Paragonimus westermani TaxID=34504 RepID=A0A8T0DDE8_9TREM|nr:hypothetical protein P879_06964 [Paragonimus westermani]